MKRKKLVTVLIAVTFMVLAMVVISGCSEQTGSGTPFSQTITREEPVIWFECQNKLNQTDPENEADYIIEGVEDPVSESTFGRETRVIWIKVYKNGKLSTYSCLDNVNLGHFSKMTDEEILKELESEEDLFICGQKDQTYEIYLYSDPAGQEVVFEGIPSLIQEDRLSDPMYFMALISKDPMPAFQVYDSYYGGYVLYNYDEGMLREACCVTRCEKDAVFSLDPMDLENATLDYKTPEEMLHEKNIELKEERKASEKTETKESDKKDAKADSSAEEKDEG